MTQTQLGHPAAIAAPVRPALLPGNRQMKTDSIDQCSSGALLYALGRPTGRAATLSTPRNHPTTGTAPTMSNTAITNDRDGLEPLKSFGWRRTDGMAQDSHSQASSR
jgi:hypothetical protein